ncbi:MAG: hypothetical protein ABIF40_03495 [archaeon]
MKELKLKLNKLYGDNFSDGVLPTLSFPAEEEYSRLLIIGGEHGDKNGSTDAILDLASRLKSSPLKHTRIDMVPVLDTAGYPDTRTSFGGGFGAEKHLDQCYVGEDKPEQITALMQGLEQNKYDFALLLTETFIEETPSLRGYFMFYQLDTNTDTGNNILTFPFPETKDIGGSILNKLQSEDVPLLNPRCSELGDGHVLARPGIVMQGFMENDKLVFRTKNEFAYVCQEHNTPALVLVAPDSNTGSYDSAKAHSIALEEVVRFFETIRKNL